MRGPVQHNFLSQPYCKWRLQPPLPFFDSDLDDMASLENFLCNMHVLYYRCLQIDTHYQQKLVCFNRYDIRAINLRINVDSCAPIIAITLPIITALKHKCQLINIGHELRSLVVKKNVI